MSVAARPSECRVSRIARARRNERKGPGRHERKWPSRRSTGRDRRRESSFLDCGSVRCRDRRVPARCRRAARFSKSSRTLSRASRTAFPRFADCVLGRARHESLAHVELQQAPEGARLVLLDIARVPGEVLLRDRLLGGSEDGLGVKDTAPTVRLGRRGRSRCLARRRSKRRTRLLSRAARRPSEAQQSNRSVMVASAVRLVFCEVKGPGDALRPQQVRKFDAVTRRTSPATPHACAGSL